ncbi:hypothetical protein BOTBODRAFT_27295 [Botryobasidium botryosum FD-172 SS1]|uniref:tripeptidyl-peptidase II n=1 Tax=Botryobasidium botryosum (strain FD-172 SS1) TaxID=930990 RepID=A0A067N6Z4_BOTB1|nr:hypothetical protein BOTBODRAFT_27295 [Botryobasidium botryosum FD-172 SS1]
MVSCLLALAFALYSVAPSAAAPRPRHSFVVKDSLAEIPHGWIQHSPAPEHYSIKLRIGLPQPNFRSLEAQLYEISNPNHHNYGKHLSKEQVDALVAPHKESTQLVDDWLESHGLSQDVLDKSSSGDWVTVTVPVSKAEEMLDCEYHAYKHPTDDDFIVRAQSYSVPDYLQGHIDVIQPTTMFGRPKAMRSTIINQGLGLDPLGVDCHTTATISCLQKLYNTEGYQPLKDSGSRLGIAGYLKEYASYSDLKQFYENWRPDAINGTFDFVSVNGGLNDQSTPGGEANLDVQYGGGISFPLLNSYYSTAGSPPVIPDSATPSNQSSEPYLEWLTFILNEANPPQVITTSYDDNERTVPKDYAIRVCNMFAQLGARGVSVLFSSGDGGVAGSQTPPSCESNDGKKAKQFIPTFPSSCPFVTSVGATYRIEPEIAAPFSSGGFSNYFSRPEYQNGHVDSYLDFLGDTYDGMYNKSGRGTPDVSAQGQNFQVIDSGKKYSTSGASASAPTFAAIVSLINDHLLRNGQAVLGFLNPWLYSIGADGLNDILGGSNPGCGTMGFSATQGWDPVTGLGTPDFKKLIDLLSDSEGDDDQ